MRFQPFDDPMECSVATILVTDDDSPTRKLYRDVLEARGYQVHEAGAGDECVALARAVRPTLVLLDIHMPRMDGFAAAAALKSHPATAPIPILAVTGLSNPAEIERALGSGCEAVLNKPVRPRDLLEAVRTLLDGSRTEGIRANAARQRRESSTLVRRSYADLRALWVPTEEVGETQLRQWMQGNQVSTCSFCARVRLPDEWREITPELRDFLERWTMLSHGICPECMAREYPGSASDR